MTTKLRLVDGTVIRIDLSDKRVVQQLQEAGNDAPGDDAASNGTTRLVRFRSITDERVWINPAHVASVESTR